MAEVLSKKRSRRGKALDPRERELKRLKLSVCDDTGFRLHLATYDQPRQRDELIERVVKDAKAENVRVTRLDLAEAGPESNLVGLLRAHLRETDLPPGWRQAVMVIGIERRLDYSVGSEGFAFLHQANLLRDALPEAAPVPVVLWLSRMASAALPAEAPDLWHWRAANFDFTGDEAPRLELLRELAMQPEDGGGLSGAQRQAHIRTLAELLGELERQGPPKSKRQAAERAGLLSELGTEHWRLGGAAEVIPFLERALGFYRDIGDRRGEGYVLHGLGQAYRRLGEPRRAIEYYEQELGIAREIGDRHSESAALGGLGGAYWGLDEIQRATDCAEQMLAIAREMGDRWSESGALGGLATVYKKQGEMQRAIEFREQQLRIAREVGHRQDECNALRNLGDAYADLGAAQRAIEFHQQALAIAQGIGDLWNEGVTLSHLGNSYLELGEPERAIEQYERQRMIASQIGDRNIESSALYNSAIALGQIGERAEATRRMGEAFRIYKQIGRPWPGSTPAT